MIYRAIEGARTLAIMVSLILFCATFLPTSAHAGVTLTWTAPTTRVNGNALAPTEIASYAIAKNGVVAGTVSGATLTYSDTGASNCVADVWSVEAIDTGGLNSAWANASITVDKVQCAPKPPTGFSAH